MFFSASDWLRLLAIVVASGIFGFFVTYYRKRLGRIGVAVAISGYGIFWLASWLTTAQGISMQVGHALILAILGGMMFAGWIYLLSR